MMTFSPNNALLQMVIVQVSSSLQFWLSLNDQFHCADAVFYSSVYVF